jgi:small multidrug resistance family-3 protein
MIFLRCLSFIFFQLLHSSRVRRQPMQKPVLLSNLQMSMQGDAMLMAKCDSRECEDSRTRHARTQSDCVNKANREPQLISGNTSLTSLSMKTFLLYAVTAIAEIVGCYLPWRWLKEGGSIWLLVPGALSLALFAWLLTLHGTAAGRVYAAYGGVYVAVAIAWLWCVDKVRPTLWDAAGAAFTLAGMAIIAFQPRV